MDIILSPQYSDYIKIKELKWNKNVIEREKIRPSNFLRDMLGFESYHKGELVKVLFIDPESKEQEIYKLINREEESEEVKNT